MSDKKPIDPEGVYTISAAARLLSVSPSTLRDLERRSKIQCTWTPGRQRRFGGADLLRFLAASRGATPREPAPTPPAGASDTGDAAARRAWLGHLVVRAQRELPVDTPAAIRLRVGTDLEHALGKWGPSSPLSDLEPLITSVVERAKHQVRTAQEESDRREKKGELLDFGLRYLRRKLDGLSTRMVGARGSFNRRHIQASLRNQLRDQLQKQLRGDEDWDHVRGRAEDFVAAWVVAHPPASRIPTTVKVVAAGVTGLVGGATAAATLSPSIRAKVAQFKAPHRLRHRPQQIPRIPPPHHPHFDRGSGLARAGRRPIGPGHGIHVRVPTSLQGSPRDASRPPAARLRVLLRRIASQAPCIPGAPTHDHEDARDPAGC